MHKYLIVTNTILCNYALCVLKFLVNKQPVFIHIAIFTHHTKKIETHLYTLFRHYFTNAFWIHKHSQSNYDTNLKLNQNELENQFSTKPIRKTAFAIEPIASTNTSSVGYGTIVSG